MATVKDKFWRLTPSDTANPRAELADPILRGPRELIAKLAPRDGIVLAIWDDHEEHGTVHGLGVVTRVESSHSSAIIEWQHADFLLTPSPQGRQKWRDMQFFAFDRNVAVRYRLFDRFTSSPDTQAVTSSRVVTATPTIVAPGTEAASRPTTRPPLLGEVQPPPVAAESPAAEGPVKHRPQRNRVTPNGDLIASPARGTFMGNRAYGIRWLVCELHVERTLKEPRVYEKLFFLDEAVALAAGHRPCKTCRPARYKMFLASARGTGGAPISGAEDLDRQLNVARRAPQVTAAISSLPNGAFIAVSENDYRLVWRDTLRQWTPSGYTDAVAFSSLSIDEARVLTPAPTLAALRNGYPVVTHPTLAHRA